MMSEKTETDKFVKCSKCKCKYINDDDEHIKHDLGYNKLNERFKCFVKCRDKGVTYSQSAKAVEWKQTSVVCENGGETATKRTIANHKSQCKCQTHNMCPKPAYRAWFLSHLYCLYIFLYIRI